MILRYIASIFLVLQFLLSSAFSMEKEKLVGEFDKVLQESNSDNFLSQMLDNPHLLSHLSQISGLSEEQVLRAAQGRTAQDMFNESKMIADRAEFGRWIPDDIRDKKALQEYLYAQSQKEELNIAPDFNTLKAHDQYILRFGRNFHRFTPLHVDCLKKICQLYASNKTRPLILDIPSGDGVHAVRMIAAGGKCLAVDQNSKAIGEAKGNMREIVKFLPPSKEKGRALAYCGDALKDDPNIYKENHYDMVWCSNFLHYTTPDQATDFAGKLFKTTKPGQNIYIQTEAPGGDKVYEYFCKNENDGYLFPGFGIFNFQGFYKSTGQSVGSSSVMTCVSKENPAPVSYDTQGILPGNQKAGYYGQDLEELKAKNPDMAIGEMAFYLRENGILEAQHHAVYHFFNITALSGLLTRAGFLILDAYYFDERNKFQDLSHILAGGIGSRVSVCIVAQKPGKGAMQNAG